MIVIYLYDQTPGPKKGFADLTRLAFDANLPG